MPSDFVQPHKTILESQFKVQKSMIYNNMWQ